ncbi:cytochrome P450 [Corallococcus sp. ZKHCc1 1396]|uniref:Cytochrome P450 n=1 Tax=Corallococcus soli TaxID=2710757 RepID=A0ABR9PN42_9BACT|nr:cytochrome P450 [Corallococcus soli]MBE4749333.1 cytochrome P450 [Corallococcus soli]
MSERFNLLSPEVRANPYPTYARMRRDAPVCQVDPGGMWAVSRHDDVLRVLKDPQRFSSQGFRQVTNPPWLGGNPFAESMLVMDPPQHGRLRGLVQKAFGAAAMARLEPRVRELCRQAVAELPRGRPVDMMAPFALRIPAAVISELLGLDPRHAARLKQWADLITGGVSTVRPEEEDRKQRARDAVAEVRAYFGDVLEARAREPAGTDVLSELRQARVDGEALTKDELIAFMALLLVGGIETVVHLLGSSLVVLREHPEVWAQLRADRSRIPAFIEEVLRYEPPAQAAPRLTTEEVELGGVKLPRGAPVLVLLASAAHDEAHFPDGDRFNLSRAGPQNLPFGHGIHFCLGAQLARMEGRLALEALLDAFRHLEAGPEPMTWHRTLVVRGPATLPLVLHPA